MFRMPVERVIPGLPCRDLDDVVPFYEALGFELTYRQQRPNPFAAVQRGGIDLHFFAVPEFEPADSMGTVVVLVPDTEALHRAFAAGLRERYGKVPVSGIPRMTRPRRKQGTAGGFSVVDPGGNWLRISAFGDPGDQPDQDDRLARVVAAAARQADSHGDEAAAIRVLENGLARHADEPEVRQLPALVYLAELRLRTEDPAAAAELIGRVEAIGLTAADRDRLASDLAALAEVKAQLAVAPNLR